MKKVLILGAGLVAKPMVEYLLERSIQVTIASRTKAKADELIKGHRHGIARAWTVDDTETLKKMIRENDLVVSLLPYAHHVMVAKCCIEFRKDMVTTSYVKPEMQALDKDARKAGIFLLNEIGVDPGIDHMSAMRIIDHVHKKGGQILEFYSITGALPAPESADNPFRYKFSWSPKGVVMAGNNDGKYLRNGKMVEIPTEELFRKTFRVEFPGIGMLEVYANRDSISYIDIYGIPEVKTIYRGTFRYPGWCETIDVMKKLRLIVYDKMTMENMTYAGMVAALAGVDAKGNVKDNVAKKLGMDTGAYALSAIEWLGLFSNNIIGRKEDSPFEVTSDLMIEKMALGEHERDMIVMQHTFLAGYPDKTREVIVSRMLDYGTPATNTSIARTVSLPAAIAVKKILEKKMNFTGVYRPTLPDIYNPVLDELETLGIRMTEEHGLPESKNIQLS
jgi:saccharopine dehydrogenase-like NADP-dependent oxidoreductase